MSRPRHYSAAAEAKRQVPEPDDDDSDEAEWDDVSGYELGRDDSEGEQQ